MHRVLMLVAMSAAGLNGADFSGRWAGALGDTGQIFLVVTQNGQDVSGTVAAGELLARPIEKPHLDGATLEFEAHGRDNRLMTFRLQWNAGILDGEMTAEGKTLKLSLAPRAGVDPQTLAFQDRPTATGPRLIFKTEPEYSQEARAAKIQGTVTLKVTIDPVGRATDLKVLHSLGHGLDEKAFECVKKWRWSPAYNRFGAPTSMFATVEVNFRLP